MSYVDELQQRVDELSTEFVKQMAHIDVLKIRLSEAKFNLERFHHHEKEKCEAQCQSIVEDIDVGEITDSVDQNIGE